MKIKLAIIPIAAIPFIFSATIAHALIVVPPPPPPPLVYTTYGWTGTCTDCPDAPSTASAALVLTNYDFGTPLLHENFFSFHYHSSVFSDLNTTLVESMSGELPGPPGGPADFSLHWIDTSLSTDFTFSTLSTGNWTLIATDTGGPFDVGTGSNFAVQQVPEPGSLALLGFGLAGLGLSRRKRH